MKNLHILYYTAAILFAIAAILSAVNGALPAAGLAILATVGLFLLGKNGTGEKNANSGKEV